ncbi:MAG: RNA polymerase sigma factor [Bacteroidales bacterium]
MSDQELIKLILTGNPNAMRELIAKYQDLVVNTCFQVLHNRQDAEDVAQDVFIKAYQAMPTLRQVDCLSFWLYRISLNKSINYFNKNRIFRKILRFDDPADHDRLQFKNGYSESPYRSMEEAEKMEVVRYALDKLPPKQKKAFILHHNEGLPYSEIAQILGLSVSSVESLIFRAKANLKKMCQEFYAQKKKSKIL